MAAPSLTPIGDYAVFKTSLRPNNNAKRYPDKGDLDQALDGFYIMNENLTVNCYVNWDADATGGDGDLFVPFNDFRNVGARVEKYISVWATSAIIVNLIGYQRRQVA